MSRRCLFILAGCVVMLYFSVILLMLNPLHSSRGGNTLTALEWCKPLHWRSPPGDLVALASYPGSGNTWLRYLLQQATGILTGSVYFDPSLFKHGFPAEYVVNGTVLVVKTHYGPMQHHFKSAILLIRNPRDALLAEFNRVFAGHIGTAPKSAFTNLPIKKQEDLAVKDWAKYVDNALEMWELFHKKWLEDFRGPIRVVYYEVLVQDLKKTLRNTLDFLHVEATEDELDCALRHREGIYRRRQRYKNFDPFTADMYVKIDQARERVLKVVNEYIERSPKTK